MKPQFTPVKFPSARQRCASYLAVRVEKNSVVFRLSKSLVSECGLKGGELFSMMHDPTHGLLAFASDAGNKTGAAKKLLIGSNGKGGKKKAMTITFPRTDLFARIFNQEHNIRGLKLYADRPKGVVVFHVPESANGEEGA